MKKVCKQCGTEFQLSESEIEFYRNKNLSLPKRCKQCRNQNKQQTPSYNNYNNNNYSNNNFSNSNFNNYGNSNYNNNSYYNRNTSNNGFQQNHIKNKRLKNKFIISAFLISVLFAIFFGVSQLLESDLPKELLNSIDNTLSTSISENTIPTTEIPTEEETEQITEKTTEKQTEAENSTSEPLVINDHRFRNYEFLKEHYEKHGIEMGFNSAEDYLTAANNVIDNPNALHKLEREDGDDVYYLQATNDFVVVSTDGYIRTYFRPDDGIEYFNRQ